MADVIAMAVDLALLRLDTGDQEILMPNATVRCCLHAAAGVPAELRVCALEVLLAAWCLLL
eukprot:CAMPEP_0172868540 /NCGR_PEP_ID=MMETSP1075-20121228/86581_1 /TAXON_ID=2916 /ORGANISM="Ceratium fusus, Strain PA161109" /LENGTH=60 /DNA_ID=CAMNT_0013718199 /DNA_START=65 /DNA_END=244 /DNA_ORIENTATION=-